jgi:glutamyl/glutaminyl-tRNA synthetase
MISAASTVRVRFAPSPTGSLHLGGALTAAANRHFADEHQGVLVLRIDDTDAARRDSGAEAAILGDLDWLGIRWDEGPLRQSERGKLYGAAAERLLSAGRADRDADGAVRFRGRQRRLTLVRPDGTATYHLASVVDDGELGITHVIRGKDLLPATPLHDELADALGLPAPQYIHHGLLVGPDGRKLSKRHGASSIADLRNEGVPAEAVRAYLDELDLPRSDVHLDLSRVYRLAVEAIAAMPDEELAERVGAERRLVPSMRGARTLVEAREFASQILAEPAPPVLDEAGRLTLERFRELRSAATPELDAATARELVRELKAVGGNLRTLRLALTGRERGPELWAVILALPVEDALRRIDAAL